MPKAKKPKTKNVLIADLSDSLYLEAVKDQLNEIVTFGDFQLANKLVVFLNGLIKKDKNFSKNYPEILEEYQNVIAKAKWVCLWFWPQKEIVSLFEQNTKEALEDDDIDIWQNTKTTLIMIYDLEERDTLKRKIRESLLRNNQTLTGTFKSQDGTTKEGTIGSWLGEYNFQLGAAPVKLVQVSIFLNNSIVKNLPDDQKRHLTVLVGFYERLKISSLVPEGFEELILVEDDEEDMEGTIRNGIFEPLEPKKEASKILISKKKSLTIKKEKIIPQQPDASTEVEQEVLAAYQGDPRQVKAITKEEQKLAKKFNGDTAKLRAEFFVAVQKKNVNRTIAILRILAQEQDLEKFLKEDAKLNKFLTAIWEKQYGKELVEKFVKNPGQLKFVRLFLRYVLEQRLEMPEADAARVGLQIANIIVSLGKKGYNKMAYFDVESKTFVWFE